MYMHAYTLYSAVRPYGCSVILASYEENEPVMYLIDPSGVSYVSDNLINLYKLLSKIHTSLNWLFCSIQKFNSLKRNVDFSGGGGVA